MRQSVWDPEQYLAFADERGRPFVDLLARVAAAEAGRVVDLGCGPGNLTTLLTARWPHAEVLGVDASPEMVARARAEVTARVRFEVGDLREWRPDGPVDVLVSNATLQWVPDHLALLPRLVGTLAPGGWLALQVPGNFEEPSHALLRRLAAAPRFAPYVGDVAVPHAHDAEVYLETLLDLGCRVDAWETTYLHVLQGEDPVLRWISGTGARPVLQALPPRVKEEFLGEYGRLLSEAYPSGPHGTVLPFRRIFVVAQAPEEAA